MTVDVRADDVREAKCPQCNGPDLACWMDAIVRCDVEGYDSGGKPILGNEEITERENHMIVCGDCGYSESMD